MTIWTKDFWKALAERVGSTFVQAFIGALIAALPDLSDLSHISWKRILLGALIAAGIAVLKSLAANAATKDGPSLTHSEQVVPPEPQPIGPANPEDPKTGGGITYGH